MHCRTFKNHQKWQKLKVFVCNRSSINEKKFDIRHRLIGATKRYHPYFWYIAQTELIHFAWPSMKDEGARSGMSSTSSCILLSLHISYSYTGQAITNSLTMICFVFFFFRRPGVSNTGGKPAVFTAKSIFNLGKTDESARPWIRRDMIWQFSIFIWHRVRFYGCFSPIFNFAVQVGG